MNLNRNLISCLFFVLIFALTAHAQEGPLSIRQLDSIHADKRFGRTAIKNYQPFFVTDKTGSSFVKKVNPAGSLGKTQNSVCFDTSARKFLYHDSLYFYSYTPAPTADGNLLISGEYVTYSPYSYGGFLLKCDYNGNVLWTKLYDSTGHSGYNYFNYYMVKELSDGSILLGGSTSNQVTDNDDVILTKTDNAGNITWNKIYKSRIWTNGNGSADFFYIQDMKQDPYAGDIYVCGPHWNTGKALIKVSSATGNIVWSNLYQYSNNGYDVSDIPFGIDILPNEIRYFGKFYGYGLHLSVIRVNKQTGDTLQTKLYKISDTLTNKVGFLSADQVVRMNNGNYRLSGSCYGAYQFQWDGITPFYQAAVAELDSNLNFVRAFAFSNPIESNIYNTRTTLFPDGSGFFSMAKVISGFTADVYYVQFMDRNIVRQRERHYYNEGMPWENLAVKTPDGGDLVIKLLGDSVTNLSKTEFRKLHISDTSSVCLGTDNYSTTIFPFSYGPDLWYMDSIGYNVFSESQTKTISKSAVSINTLPGCEMISHCDTLKLLASTSTICVGESITIIIRKNRECGSTVPLLYDTTVVSSALQLNDSTFTFQFDAPWSGFIYGSLQGCVLMKDSVAVNVLQAPAILSLGPDTSICPGNTIILNAHTGYASYLWQDGSVDSSFTVTEPGLYYVTTTNACGGNFTDSVIVSPHPPVPIDIGPDRIKCNSDTIHLQATPGFLNYTWSPDYNISSTSSQNVVISPATDTSYFIKAEKTPGCFAYDTITVTVHHSPPVFLGNDTSFCSGSTILLDAGNGFSSYQWNNGSTSQQLAVNTAGDYSVIAATVQGCRSSDTLKVLTVFANPVVSLADKPFICTGTSVVFDAGAFSGYSWSTGSISQTITVNLPGEYFVTVTDNNQCHGSDTTRILALFSLPAAFLPGDTNICSYGSLQLKPTTLFSSYLWSNAQTSPSITITQPGVYWLQATDNDHCSGKDTIIVNPKDCMKGFYIPNAFTPNNDGKNDIFMPLLFGNVKQYRFTIYNRWGEKVFDTKQTGKGWDGMIGGTKQDTNMFIWSCSYQFEGEELKVEKGVVMLVR